MNSTNGLYTYRDGLADDEARASAMLVSLGGFVDAGHTQQLLAAHILAHHEHELVATFDADQLVDYRSRRPMMGFETDRYTSYDAPKIELHRVRDLDGTPFLMLTGVEPDYQWERVAAAVQEIVDELGVELTVLAHGVPMGVPHTRPIGVTAHGSNPALIGDSVSMIGKMLVPGSIEALLELRLGEAGRDVVGYAVHVPHYLAQIALPGASLVALERIAGVTGLRLERAELEAGAAKAAEALRSELADREDVAQVVAALERQYDAQVARTEPRGLTAGGEASLPTADEIGAEAEAFLRELGGGDHDG